MNEIKLFSNEEFGSIRTVIENDKVLFGATDVAKALGYAVPRKAVFDHCRYVLKRNVPHPQSSDKEIEMSFIPESDVYRLAFGSKLPNAEKFTDWVTEEVLPDIRKHGMYMTSNFVESLMSNPEAIGSFILEYAKEKKKNEQLEAEVTEMKPKATYYDLVLRTKNAVNITTIAKDYALSATTLNKMLHEYGIQYKQGGTWVLYQKYADMGYTKSTTSVYTNSAGEECAAVHTKWTQKGRLFIYEVLKEHGILPEVEQEEDQKVVNLFD